MGLGGYPGWACVFFSLLITVFFFLYPFVCLIFFKKNHLSIFDLLRIEWFFHIWCFRSTVDINFFLLLIFFSSHNLTLFFKLVFMIFFNFLSIGLSQSHNLTHKFGWLTRANLCIFFLFMIAIFLSFFFIDYFFSISSFNFWLVENWA
jgi:hypothetical protein